MKAIVVVVAVVAMMAVAVSASTVVRPAGKLMPVFLETGSGLRLARCNDTKKCAPNVPHVKCKLKMTCCESLQCPFQGGLCCAGGSHCCPVNTQCVQGDPGTPPGCLHLKVDNSSSAQPNKSADVGQPQIGHSVSPRKSGLYEDPFATNKQNTAFAKARAHYIKKKWDMDPQQQAPLPATHEPTYDESKLPPLTVAHGPKHSFTNLDIGSSKSGSGEGEESTEEAAESSDSKPDPEAVAAAVAAAEAATQGTRDRFGNNGVKKILDLASRLAETQVGAKMGDFGLESKFLPDANHASKHGSKHATSGSASASADAADDGGEGDTITTSSGGVYKRVQSGGATPISPHHSLDFPDDKAHLLASNLVKNHHDVIKADPDAYEPSSSDDDESEEASSASASASASGSAKSASKKSAGKSLSKSGSKPASGAESSGAESSGAESSGAESSGAESSGSSEGTEDLKSMVKKQAAQISKMVEATKEITTNAAIAAAKAQWATQDKTGGTVAAVPIRVKKDVSVKRSESSGSGGSAASSKSGSSASGPSLIAATTADNRFTTKPQDTPAKPLRTAVDMSKLMPPDPYDMTPTKAVADDEPAALVEDEAVRHNARHKSHTKHRRAHRRHAHQHKKEMPLDKNEYDEGYVFHNNADKNGELEQLSTMTGGLVPTGPPGAPLNV
eukprot:TRINITY_DN66795_c6_g2_i1.p1 TRINITY_DN66795_c6_g2~~TRINITY_DN66795_c6_g2_i1.p1  ORF type:complete len:674 (+),score=339.12 TRINITY_DN66795_c6_g2_i1:20-2041(+)